MTIKIINGNFVKVDLKDDGSYIEQCTLDIKNKEYSPLVFADLVRAIADMKTVKLSYRFSGLPFANKLAIAAMSYILHLKWKDDNARKIGYQKDGVHKLFDQDPALMTEEKDAHWSRAALYAAHEARMAIGYGVPEFVTTDDIQWVADFFGKVNNVNLLRIKNEAKESAKSAHKLGKLVAAPGEKSIKETLYRYAMELYNAGKEAAYAKADYVSTHLEDIAWTMSDDSFAKRDFRFDSVDLQNMIDDYIGDHVMKMNEILDTAYENANRSARSFSALRAKEGRELIDIIETVRRYALTEKEIEAAEARAAEAEEAFKEFDF